MRRRRRRASNPNAGASLALSAASVTLPLLPWLLVAGGAYYLYKRFLSGPAAEAAKVAGDVAQGYGQAAQIAMDPSQWKQVYAAEQAAWQAAGGEGSPIAQPYYGPAGAWTGGA